ncbi:hypothetical protein HIM_06599 [Hirsutella minnesotensis 3608]|uniref:Carboxypeptidase S1 n=1 Tax=Hirsutella minnesotensis 3608 TaxID=1043627 RepID=A0A0F7ZIR3_9HYPO|nr:hypothetical protein HIM_06599 [Hirsutella minnesotensis 3608]
MLLLHVALFAACCEAWSQFIESNSQRRNLTVVRVPGESGLEVSYTDPSSACRTASESQKQISGWVTIPGEPAANVFFWFVEARKRTDSLTVWLNGGPGSSSLVGMFAELGPCEVLERGLDRYETVAREWGWDGASNLLFIDQPLHAGFSYDVPTNATQNLLDGNIQSPPFSASISSTSRFLYNGTFSSNSPANTPGTIKAASMAIWHTLQGFLGAFPQYRTSDVGHSALNVFAQSYAGMFGPVVAETLQEQNAKRLTGALNPNTTLETGLSTLGIVNGFVDYRTQLPTYPAFAVNNTYGERLMTDEEVQRNWEAFSATGGCKDLLAKCEDFANKPRASDEKLQTETCRDATNACKSIGVEYYERKSGGNPYDITSPKASTKPLLFFAEYLNQASTLQALGSPVNFTLFSNAVYEKFFSLGEPAKGGHIKRLAALLRKGVQVSLIYGDKDYLCNWFGGEAVSLAIAAEAGGDYATHFNATTYSPIAVNETYEGGQVRQYGNLSFSRIYGAGHMPGVLQPETSFRIFSRLIKKQPVAAMSAPDEVLNGTFGQPVLPFVDDLSLHPPSTCFVRSFDETCDDKMRELVSSGAGVMRNGVLHDNLKILARR